MNHRKWSTQILSLPPYGDLIDEHNSLYADWKQCSLEAERLAKVNGDLCDKITELQQPIRVPFSDAQIEKMAKAARSAFGDDIVDWENSFCRDNWRSAIRAALSAGGLEPCVVPEYKPEDVAFSTATHLRNKLASANGKIGRQAAELTKLYHLRQGDAGERMRMERELEAVKDQLAKESEWVRVYKQDRDDALAELAQAREQLADRAIIEVPVGLPSTEELAEISWNAWCDSQEKLCLNYLDYWKELRDTDRISYIESIRAVLQHLAPYLLPNAPAQNIDQPKQTTPDIEPATLERLAEIARNAFKWRPNAADGRNETWPEVVLAILAVVKPVVDITTKEADEWLKNYLGDGHFRDFLNSKIRYSVRVPKDKVEALAKALADATKEWYSADQKDICLEKHESTAALRHFGMEVEG